VVTVILAVAVLLWGCVPPTEPSGEQQDIRADTNVYRAQNSVSAEAWSVNLQTWAQNQADANAASQQNNQSDLTALLAKYPSLSTCGENVLTGASSAFADGSTVVAHWVADAVAKAKLLNPAFDITGVGITIANSQVWIVADYCG
jgi:uncharacterized protein YkwD